MDPTNNRILVIGGTGHYGRFITQSLAKHGVRVRLLTRNPSNAKALFGDRVDIVSGDLENPASLESAMRGIDGIVYAVSAISIKQIRRFKEIEQDAVISSLQIARKMKIPRITYISVFEVDKSFAHRNRIATADEKAFVEDYISKSDFNWTILGAPPSMEIFFRMIRGTTMMVPGGGPKGLPTVSSVDVGEIAAQTVLRADLTGQRIQMVASQAYSFPDAARRISSVWGIPVGFRKIPIILPKIAYVLTTPLAPVSDRILYVRTLLRFIRLLNNFPESYIEKVPALHDRLRSIFSYAPSTIEVEAGRRVPRSGSRPAQPELHR